MQRPRDLGAGCDFHDGAIPHERGVELVGQIAFRGTGSGEAYPLPTLPRPPP